MEDEYSYKNFFDRYLDNTVDYDIKKYSIQKNRQESQRDKSFNIDWFKIKEYEDDTYNQKVQSVIDKEFAGIPKEKILEALKEKYPEEFI